MANFYSPKLPLRLGNNGDFISISNRSENIRQNLRILLLTSPGEKIMMPQFGCGLKNFLFENRELVSITTTEDFIDSEERESLEVVIKKTIISQIREYIKDILVNSIDVSFEENSINVSISYNINEFVEDTVTVTV